MPVALMASPNVSRSPYHAAATATAADGHGHHALGHVGHGHGHAGHLPSRSPPIPDYRLPSTLATPTGPIPEMQPDVLAALLSARPRSYPGALELPPSERYPVLVLDLRPHSAFLAGHIVGAVNLCLPTTLLRRKGYDMDKVIAGAPDADRASLARWDRVRHIVLYDATCPLAATTAAAVRAPVKGLAESPIPHVAAKLHASPATVHCLYGGYDAFARAYPKLAVCPSPPAPPEADAAVAAAAADEDAGGPVIDGPVTAAITRPSQPPRSTSVPSLQLGGSLAAAARGPGPPAAAAHSASPVFARRDSGIPPLTLPPGLGIATVRRAINFGGAPTSTSSHIVAPGGASPSTPSTGSSSSSSGLGSPAKSVLRMMLPHHSVHREQIHPHHPHHHHHHHHQLAHQRLTGAAPGAPPAAPVPASSAAPSFAPSCLNGPIALPPSAAPAPTQQQQPPQQQQQQPPRQQQSWPVQPEQPAAVACTAAAAPPSGPGFLAKRRPGTAPVATGLAARRGPVLRLNLAQVNAACPPVFSFKTRFQLLSSVTPRELSAHAPRWLRDLFATGGIISELQSKFLNIKLSEPPPPTNLVTAKNRYYNVFPYEHNRVRLAGRPRDLSPADQRSDYINASLITPPYTTDTFIATQAPLPDTMGDFWTMVYGEDVGVVINLAPESEIAADKAIKYWPEAGEVQVLDAMQVHHVPGAREERFEYGIIRRHLAVTPLAGSAAAAAGADASAAAPAKRVVHISFEDWDDGEAPSVDSVLYLLRLVNSMRPAGSASAPLPPVVVHCSAGCGRTGTYIALHALLQLLSGAAAGARTFLTPPTLARSPPSWSGAPASTGSSPTEAMDVDVDPSAVALAAQLVVEDPIPHLVRQLRIQRMMMVQNTKQFMFIYEALVHLVQTAMPRCVFPPAIGRAAGCAACIDDAAAAAAVVAPPRSSSASGSPMTGISPAAAAATIEPPAAAPAPALVPPRLVRAPSATTTPRPSGESSSPPTTTFHRPARPPLRLPPTSSTANSAALAAAASVAAGIPPGWTTHAHMGSHLVRSRSPTRGMLGEPSPGASSPAAAACSPSAAATVRPMSPPCHRRRGSSQPMFVALVSST
ncbi:phosphotyrosine-specific ptp2-like protein [Blastocladiella emersonii ATCC 22665]|nr:phosphotyrosine-specific ptp2-like protein [Blastocladiella emersonii ATCC 22665]